MTDINPTALSAEDIVDDTNEQRARLDRAGDRWMADAEARTFARETGVRQALRSDLETGRDWARERAFLARTKIEDKPLKATAYALGVGLLIGLLLRR
ncbi:glycine zipper domain-containing protein [Brevundimonas sp.]|uniref:glycine zipper domain-containing protein n=1 Tax=Brevundimonas sp. TaxID=1871086 RepID=UPI003D13A226